MSSQAPPPVRHRRVFYIPGYDPFPPRRYRELYRKESTAQAAISGYDIAMKPGLDGDGFGWRVGSMIDGQPAQAEIEVLVWSDIVQNSRPPSVLATYRDLCVTAWIYVSTGALFRLARLRKGPVIAALYPVVALLAQAGLAFGLGWSIYRIASEMALELFGTASGYFVSIFGAIIGLLVAGLALRWFKEHDGKFFAYYLMHDFAYSASERGAYPPELEKRLAEFRLKIAEALKSEVDEVLVVGHSSGAHLAVSVLADLMQEGDISDDSPAIGFLSLGHVVPMITFLPNAWRLRRDLRSVSLDPRVTWVDVTAPGDGCCFALCDPVAVSGQATQSKRGPLVFSAAFTQSLSRKQWKSLRWRFFRLHFQYLCAFDRPKDYDYFRITAGPLRLADRYLDRAASRSRIDRTVSAYTSVKQ